SPQSRQDQGPAPVPSRTPERGRRQEGECRPRFPGSPVRWRACERWRPKTLRRRSLWPQRPGWRRPPRRPRGGLGWAGAWASFRLGTLGRRASGPPRTPVGVVCFPVKDGGDQADASSRRRFPAGGPAMTVRPLVQRSTLPVGRAARGVLLIATGWLLIEGLPFVLGCAIMCAAAAGAIALATSHLRDR